MFNQVLKTQYLSTITWKETKVRIITVKFFLEIVKMKIWMVAVFCAYLAVAFGEGNKFFNFLQ